MLRDTLWCGVACYGMQCEDPDPHPDTHGFASFWKLEPDPHQSEKQGPYPHQSEKLEALQGHIGALEGPNLEKNDCWIRISIKLKR